jgi:hypothetical protein
MKNMSDNNWTFGGAFALGALIATFLLFWLSVALFIAGGASDRKAIAECQQNLPRSEKCILIAMPENKLEHQ